MSETVAHSNSITRRLSLIVGGALVAAVLVVGGLALLEQQRQLTRSLDTKAAGLAQFLAQVSPLSVLSLNFVEMNNNVKKVVLTDDEAIYAIIVNEQRIPLAYYFKSPEPALTEEARALVAARAPLAAIEAMRRSARVLEVQAPIDAADQRIGSVIVGFSFERMHQALLRQIALIGMVLVVVTGATLLLLGLALRRILQPVRTLTSAARQISAGDLDVALGGTDRRDELGVLSRAFQSMAGQLRELIADMAHRQMEAQRQSLLSRIEESRKMDEARKMESLGRLAGGIAHDFNNILGAVLGYAHFIGEDLPDDSPIQGYVRKVLSSGERGKRLVEQIMAFARSKEALRVPLSMAEVVTQSLPIVEVALPTSLRLVLDIVADAPPVEADRDQMTQVFLNLCMNARDAMEGRAGSVTIAVKVLPAGSPILRRAAETPVERVAAPDTWTDADGFNNAIIGRCDARKPHVALSVRDEGTGMEAALISKIFDPFFTTRAVGRGTGFGLSVVHGVMLDHQGVISVRSRPGQGSTLTVILPQAEGQAAATPPPPPIRPDAPPVGTAGRLLLVDDDDNFGEMTKVMLERIGWKVTHCSTPGAALAVFAEEPDQWSLVVTDQVMPEFSGLDLIGRIKEMRPLIPCILCSGRLDVVDVDRFPAGNTQFLQKPFTSEDLVAACARMGISTLR